MTTTFDTTLANLGIGRTGVGRGPTFRPPASKRSARPIS